MTENNDNKQYPHVASTVGKPSASGKIETATFAAGCFWTVEAVFRAIEGVLETSCGFMGGQVDAPSYEEVYTDKTGHAEVVDIKFDPEMVTFSRLVDIFWANHNPTLVNEQAGDVGTRYRTEIFYHSPEQQRIAEESKATLDASDKFAKPIATKITAAEEFYAAEEYHQRYFEKNGITACGL